MTCLDPADPLSAPISGHDTDRAPPPTAPPPALDLERRIKLLASERYDVLLAGLRLRCAVAINGWLDVHPIGDHEPIEPVSPDEIVVRMDRGIERYAYVRRPGADELEELGPGINSTTDVEALLTLTAWAELDRSEVAS